MDEDVVPDRMPRRKSITVTIPLRVYDELIEYCREHNTLRSVAISKLIEHALECNKMPTDEL